MKPGVRDRLRLHRETLRTLSTDQLGRAAGGSGIYSGTGTLYMAPKSNVWSADVNVICRG